MKKIVDFISIKYSEPIHMNDIAYAVGYSDAFTFSKAFKTQVGVAPSEFRERMGRRNLL